MRWFSGWTSAWPQQAISARHQRTPSAHTRYSAVRMKLWWVEDTESGFYWFYVKTRHRSNGNVSFSQLNTAVWVFALSRTICAASLPSAAVSSAFIKPLRVVAASQHLHQWKELWLPRGSYVDEKVRYVSELSSNFCFLNAGVGEGHRRQTLVIKNALKLTRPRIRKDRLLLLQCFQWHIPQ